MRAASRAISALLLIASSMARGSCAALISGSSRAPRSKSRRRNASGVLLLVLLVPALRLRGRRRVGDVPHAELAEAERLVVARGPATATAPAHDHAAAFMEAAAGRAVEAAPARRAVAVARAGSG